MVLLQQMIVLFIMMLFGWFGGRKGVFDDEFIGKLTWLVVNIANPALALSASVCADGAIRGESLVVSCVVAVLMYIILIPLGILVSNIIRAKEEDKGTYQLMTVFANIGFMGYPLIKVMFGSEALLYGTPFLLLYNVFIYTWGISVMQKGKEKTEGFSLRKVMNPGVAAGIISIIIYLVGIDMPAFIEDSVEMLSNIAAPLSMMVIGHSFCKMKLRELFTDVRLLIFSAIKLLVIPVAGMMILKLFIDNELLLAVCTVVLATPSGSMTAMLAREYGGNYETASKGVALTTLLSVVTLPLVFAIV